MTGLPAPRADLQTRRVGDETLVVDLGSDEVLALSPLGATVFAACSAGSSYEQTAALVGGPATVREALDELSDAGLLVGSTRRNVLRGGVLGATALAATVALPTLAFAVSPTTTTTYGGAAVTRTEQDSETRGFYVVDVTRSLPAGTLTSFTYFGQPSATPNAAPDGTPANAGHVPPYGPTGTFQFFVIDANKKFTYVGNAMPAVPGAMTVPVANGTPVSAGSQIGVYFVPNAVPPVYAPIFFTTVTTAQRYAYAVMDVPAVGGTASENGPYMGGMLQRDYSFNATVTHT